MVVCSRLAMWLILALLCATLAQAQQEPPAPQADSEQAEATAPDQEVEVNEDNYRQFMELKDDLRQRTVMPEDSYQSRSGLQKLDNLPEASQKHLRNELREIISRGDRWQPGDENTDYPYVPSEAAMGSASLRNQEAEAWGELLDNYHDREAQIYANSARSRAAAAASGAMPGQAGEPSASEGSREGQAAQANQQQGSQAGNAGDSFAPGAQDAGGEQNTEGVAQNAMEFLQQAGYQGGSTASGDEQQQTEENQQAGAQAQPGTQQSPTSAIAQSAVSESTAQANSQAQSEQGSEQNAMEFLQQGQNQQAANQQDSVADPGSEQASDDSESSAVDQQQDTVVADLQSPSPGTTTRDSDDPATEGTSQNALEYLAGENSSVTGIAQDTLSIEDLLKARGVATGIGAAQDEPDEPPDVPK